MTGRIIYDTIYIVKATPETLSTLKPDILAAIVPSDAKQQKEAFLSGQIRNPQHNYDKLERNFLPDLDRVIRVGQLAIAELPSDGRKHERVFDDYIESFATTLDYMDALRRYNATEDPHTKAMLRRQIMLQNIEANGEPTRADYEHVLGSYLDVIDNKQLTGTALQTYSELIQLLPAIENAQNPDGYKPHIETMIWMQSAVDALYGDMLSHVEDDRAYDPQQLAELFRTVIREEFGEAAADWQVEVAAAKSINVKSWDKKIVIPTDRGEVSSETAKDLICHEIGVHMMRAVSGYNTDISPLATGMPGYIDSEEGLAMVMQQARNGEYKEAGHALYLTASIAHIEGKDFRDTFEVMWRIAALSGLKSGAEMTDEVVEKARDSAYRQCMRIFRGTDDIPWLKDIQYYTGAQSVWRYLDANCGDEQALRLMLMGKTNVNNPDHLRTLLESKTA